MHPHLPRLPSPPPPREPCPRVLPPLSPHGRASRGLTADGEAQVSLGGLSRPARRSLPEALLGSPQEGGAGVSARAVCTWGEGVEVGARDSVGALLPPRARSGPQGTAGSSRRISGVQPPGAQSAREGAAASHNSEARAGVCGARSSEPGAAIPRGAGPSPEAGRPWTPRGRTARTGRRARLQWDTQPRAGKGWAVSLPRQTESDPGLPAPCPGARPSAHRSQVPASRHGLLCRCPFLWGGGSERPGVGGDTPPS